MGGEDKEDKQYNDFDAIVQDGINAVADQNAQDHVVCIIDRSGSMHSIAGDVEGGVRSFVEQQRETKDNAKFTLVEFDHKVNRVYDRVDITDIDTYRFFPGGRTALLDAIGQTLSDFLACSYDKVIVTIVTDGFENSSCEYTKEQINQMIKQCEERGWEVTFLAADQDAIKEGGALGLSHSHTLDWNKSGEGIHDAFATASINTTAYRTNSKAPGESVRDYYVDISTD